jgi:hypothetical protein
VPYVMRIEGLVIKTRGRAKRAHDAREVVFVFLSDVLIDDLKTGRSYSIFGTHGHPLAMRCAGRLDASRRDGQPSAPLARRPFWSLISAAASSRAARFRRAAPTRFSPLTASTGQSLAMSKMEKRDDESP